MKVERGKEERYNYISYMEGQCRMFGQITSISETPNALGEITFRCLVYPCDEEIDDIRIDDTRFFTFKNFTTYEIGYSVEVYAKESDLKKYYPESFI